VKIVKLGEVVELFNGSTPLKTNKNYWVNGDVPWFTVDDLRKQGKYITYTEKFITKLGLKESSISLIPENAVLLCCTASVGAIAINKIRLTTNQQFNALVVKNPEQLLVEYLYYWFLANMDALKSLGRATTIDYVSMSKLRDMALQLPSLEKQSEIVGKLDSIFAEIELLENNLVISDKKTDQLLQSLLSSEYSLTSDENSNNPSVPQGSGIKVLPLKDFCKMYQPPTISFKEMIPDGKFIVFGANGPIGRYNKFNHEEPQLLVTCRGATCGAVNMSEPFSWINGNAMVIQPDLEMATLEYMKYAFLGGIDVSSSITGSAQPQITRTTLEVIKVPLPTLEKQSEIVEKLDSAFAEIGLLKSRIKVEKDYAVALRQSLLSSDFALEVAVA
jgi:restriction endonuclease S subunit